jgi:HD-GYP domain-containing protein (c-di-GMP phosphodiesterase class II)
VAAHQLGAAVLARPNIDYSLFRIDTLVDNSTTDFDLFINLHQHFILYSGNGYKWQRSELTDLLRTGHESLYIRASDLPKARMYETLVRLPQIEKEQAPRERIQTIEQVGAKFIQCLYEGELTEGCVRKAEVIAGSMADCIREDPGCIQMLSGLADHDYYTYFHSVRVAAYAVAVSVAMGLTDPEHLRSIALGGIFHDIGKRDVPLSVLNKKGPLSESEWQLMRSHPEKGFTSVSESILAHVPREIVLHHHEKLNGSGYPHGLARGSLLLEVQIATLADIFDALTSSRSYQTKRTRYEGLDFIKHKLLGDEIAPDVFKALVMCLAT